MTSFDPERLRAGLLPAGAVLPCPDGFRRAAVLVPILEGPAGLEIAFTVRSATLPHHAGQIAFPGGGAEPGESPEDTARRETEEEVGLRVPPEAILGRLHDLPSPAAYQATPVVAFLPAPSGWRFRPEEVAEVFTAPLAELRAVTPRTLERTFRGRPRRLTQYLWRGRDIWGFTGNVLHDLLARLDAAERGA